MSGECSQTAQFSGHHQHHASSPAKRQRTDGYFTFYLIRECLNDDVINSC